MNLNLSLISLLLWVLSVSACATKPVPQPPYSIEQLNAFVDQEELNAVKSINYYKRRIEEGLLLAEHGAIYEHGAILSERKSFGLTPGLQSVFVPGAIFHEFWFDGSRELTIKEVQLDPGSSLGFDKDGYVASLRIDDFTEADLTQINRLKHLQSIYIYGSDSYLVDDLDVSLLDKNLNLVSFLYGATQAKNVSALCNFEALEMIKIHRAKVLGIADFTDCLPKLKYLSIATANGEGVVIKDMPALEYLRVSDSNWDYVRIDGSTLPNIKSMTLGDLNIKNGFGDIKLPKHLTQLYLRESENDATSQLKLPEGLEYLDLEKAQLSDYSFITQAKNLRYLSLGYSNFTQWELLKEFKNLEALDLNRSLLDNAALHHIAELENLSYLSFSDTQVTDARPLAKLKKLTVFNAAFTNIALDKFPLIESKGYIGFPDDDHYHSPPYPEHIKQMKENSMELMACFKAEVCLEPPWF